MGRVRLQVALDCLSYSLETFILNNVEPGVNGNEKCTTFGKIKMYHRPG